MTYLLDGNILAALMIDDHEHHTRAQRWFDTLTTPFATCCVTQGTLLRMVLKLVPEMTPEKTWKVLSQVTQLPRHEFWDDGFSYEHVSTYKLQGHRQVTDFWLAELARRNGGMLATMDTGLAADQPDAVELIP